MIDSCHLFWNTSHCLPFYHSTLVEAEEDAMMDLMVKDIVVGTEVEEDMII